MEIGLYSCNTEHLSIRQVYVIEPTTTSASSSQRIEPWDRQGHEEDEARASVTWFDLDGDG